MSNRLKLIAAVVLLVIAIPAGRWVRHARPWETLTQRAHRLCGECGLEADEINRLIDEFGDPTRTRAQGLALFFGTFENPAAAKPCLPCAEAVLDAAGYETLREESQDEARTERG